MKGEKNMNVYESIVNSLNQVIDYEKGFTDNVRVQNISTTDKESSDTFGLSAFDIASWFIQYNNSQEETDLLTDLKLQKLLYYAQGISIKYTGKTLFKENIYAFRYGPVVKEVYNKYQKFGRNHIDETVNIPEFENDIRVILEDVYEDYGQYSAWKLVEMTHNESPWLKTEKNSIITVEKMREFFAR